MFRSTLLITLLALALHAHAKPEKCPSFVGKTPFDQTKMTGTWYMIACYFPEEKSETKKCAKLNLTQLSTDSGNIMKADFSGLSDGKNIGGDGYSQPIKDEKTAMFYGVMKKNTEDRYSGVYKQGVIATDYDTYTLFMACKMSFNEEKKQFEPKMKLEILSRTTSLSEETLKVLMNMMSSYDINMDKIKMIDHTDC